MKAPLSPVYNNRNCIADCIQSVHNQTLIQTLVKVVWLILEVQLDGTSTK
jgi:glycosyltransferase involved in cell wall biosynthesis